LEIDSGAKRNPLPEIVIPGATVDQTDFCLDQVSTNSLILHFNTLFFVFGRVLGVVVDLQGVGPNQTWVFQGQPVGTRVQSQNCARVPATVASTARGLPLRNGKLSVQDLTLPSFFSFCVFGRMYVHWREREHEASNEAVAADPNVMAVLM
jgi:hypothetical protein